MTCHIRPRRKLRLGREPPYRMAGQKSVRCSVGRRFTLGASRAGKSCPIKRYETKRPSKQAIPRNSQRMQYADSGGHPPNPLSPCTLKIHAGERKKKERLRDPNASRFTVLFCAAALCCRCNIYATQVKTQNLGDGQTQEIRFHNFQPRSCVPQKKVVPAEKNMH